jgi:hypothetical protein
MATWIGGIPRVKGVVRKVEFEVVLPLPLIIRSDIIHDSIDRFDTIDRNLAL